MITRDGYDADHRYYTADTLEEAIEFMVMWEFGPKIRERIDDVTLFGIVINPLEFDRYFIVDIKWNEEEEF